jgi:hypothetical protein
MRAAYDQVYMYSMGRPGFILQHVADASTVQTATADTKPIGILFGLVGLYLRVEKQFSGSEVQAAHTELARKKREWPKVSLPDNRGSITVADVLAADAGSERDRAIDDWCKSVWSACIVNREMLMDLLREYRII